MANIFTAPISSLFTFIIHCRLCHRLIYLHPKTKAHVGGELRVPFTPINRGTSMIVKATPDANGTSLSSPRTPFARPSDSKEKSVPVENLPLESKIQTVLDHRITMKLAKKIRLRRKRLVRKQHLRKKGRWPPSKLNKNKNV